MRKISLCVLVLAVFSILASVAMADPPENDNCSYAIAINEVSELAYSTNEASFDGEGYCMDSPNIWYVYTPTFTGNMKITLTADYSAKMAVYNGGDCSPIADEIGCTSESSISFAATLGNQYLIEVGGTGEQIGSGFLTIEEAPESPSNDNCADADDAGTLQDNEAVQLTGTVAEATIDCPNLYSPEVWIKFTVPDYMNVTIDFCDHPGGLDMYSVAMGLYLDCPCGNDINYNELNYCGNNNPSMRWQYLPAGTYYYPIMSSYTLDSTYTVKIVGVLSSTPPTGACCNNDSLTCEVIDQFSCIHVLGGYWRGEGTDCGTYDEETGWSGCIDEEPTGACCYEGGTSCVDNVTMEDCYSIYFGEWRGEGVVCGEADSETGVYEGCGNSGSTTGACCYDDGYSCENDVSESDCYDFYMGEYKGDGSFCGEINPESGVYQGCHTPSPGACCFNGGINCEIVSSESECTNGYGGNWKGQGSSCGVFDDEEGWSGCYSPPLGACCLEDGTMCSDNVSEIDCLDGYMGTWMGEGSVCGEYNDETGFPGCQGPDTYEYLPGDANMLAGLWPPRVIGSDVTYLVNYFRGISGPCLFEGFFACADANGDCRVVGSDVTYLVNFFRGLNTLSYCPEYETNWADNPPSVMPDGWPNCETPSLINGLNKPVSGR